MNEPSVGAAPDGRTRTWRLSTTGQLEPADGKPAGTFTGQEWRAQRWPDCPVCGAKNVEPDRVDVRKMSNTAPVFVVGWWECPNSCDPRAAKAT